MKATTNTINTKGITHLRKETYGAAFAKEMREELKRRGAKGVTVRINRRGYTDSLTITVKMSPEDYATIAEAAERYSLAQFLCDWDRRGIYFGGRWHDPKSAYNLPHEERERAHKQFLADAIGQARDFANHHYNDRDYHWEFSQSGYERLRDIYRIAAQWNWDKSDPMTDYFDVGYYLNINVRAPEGFAPAEN